MNWALKNEQNSQRKGNKVGRQAVGPTGANIQLFSKNLLSAYYAHGTMLATSSMTGSREKHPCSHGARFPSSTHPISTRVLAAPAQRYTLVGIEDMTVANGTSPDPHGACTQWRKTDNK